MTTSKLLGPSKSRPHAGEDHPPPHVHAVYAEYEAFVAIDTGEVIEDTLPESAARLVKEWRRASVGEPLEKIAGLDAE